jgi:hypothetical protein
MAVVHLAGVGSAVALSVRGKSGLAAAEAARRKVGVAVQDKPDSAAAAAHNNIDNAAMNNKTT